MATADPNWRALADEHSSERVDRLRQVWEEKTQCSIDAVFFNERFGAEFEKYIPLLDAVSALDVGLKREEFESCPYCRTELNENREPLTGCESGETPCAYEEDPSDPKIQVRYIRELPDSRDLRWAILIHGMNTHGLWQQDFSWQVTKMFRYAIPVDSYKYGRITISPFFFWRQLYVNRLRKRIETRMAEMKEAGITGPPDLIAHSFGTWLFMSVLMQDPPLKFGRVILTGCIIPPDFDWTPYLDGTAAERRVDAVLCHYGKKDIVVPLARFFIPNAGPSGRIGFKRKIDGLFLQGENDFGHSSYFAPARLQSVIEGVWRPFIELGSRDEGLQFDKNVDEKSLRWESRRFWFFAGCLPKWALLAAAGGTVYLAVRTLPILPISQILLTALALFIVFLGIPLALSQVWKILVLPFRRD